MYWLPSCISSTLRIPDKIDPQLREIPVKLVPVAVPVEKYEDCGTSNHQLVSYTLPGWAKNHADTPYAREELVGRTDGIQDENCLWNEVFWLSIATIDHVSTIKLSNSVVSTRSDICSAFVSQKFKERPVLIWKPLHEENIERVSPNMRDDHAGIVTDDTVRAVLFAPLRIRLPTNGSLLILLNSTHSSVPSTKTSVRRKS